MHWRTKSRDIFWQFFLRDDKRIRKKKSKNKKKNAIKTIVDELLEYQREQDKKFEVKFDEQQKADIEERQKDLNFVLKLGKIFSGNSK